MWSRIRRRRLGCSVHVHVQTDTGCEGAGVKRRNEYDHDDHDAHFVPFVRGWLGSTDVPSLSLLSEECCCCCSSLRSCLSSSEPGRAVKKSLPCRHVCVEEDIGLRTVVIGRM